jgi:hypothetical protein
MDELLFTLECINCRNNEFLYDTFMHVYNVLGSITFNDRKYCPTDQHKMLDNEKTFSIIIIFKMPLFNFFLENFLLNIEKS